MPENDGFSKLAVIGLGLIGGSVAAGLRRQGLAPYITAWDVNETSLNLGRDLGVIDEVASDIASATADADLIVLAVPVQAMGEVLKHIPDNGQLMTDVGSVKGGVIRAAIDVYGALPATFVPGHPIAGSEQHGVIASNPDLFQQHRVILTPADTTDEHAVNRITDMWQALGANVVTMSPEHHDEVLAQTSHLPHLLAYTLVDALSRGGDSMEVFQYAAGGFRDFTRIAASDPVMWRDIFQANRAPLLAALDDFSATLDSLKTSIQQDDLEDVQQILTRAKAARDHFTSLNAAPGPNKTDE